jgi:small subunit ribosomal protein S20
MAHSKQAKKRVRSSEGKRLRHKARKTEVKTLTKKVLGELTEKKDAKTAEPAFRALQKKLDKGAGAHTFHKNTVARKKSRLQRKLNKLKKAPAAPASS